MSYHCSIYAIDEVDTDNIDYSPFKSAQDMTMHLGITKGDWRKRKKAENDKKLLRAAKRKSRAKSESFLQSLVGEMDL